MPPANPERKDRTIHVTKTTHERLRKRKTSKGEYYDSVINRMLDLLDQLDPDREHRTRLLLERMGSR